jgi:hypothetical protein
VTASIKCGAGCVDCSILSVNASLVSVCCIIVSSKGRFVGTLRTPPGSATGTGALEWNTGLECWIRMLEGMMSNRA